MRFLLLLFIYIWSADLIAQDTLYLLNKTILVGELIEIDFATVRFDAEDIPDIITVQLEEIQTLHIQSKRLTVETIFKQTYSGYFASSNQPGVVKMITDTDTLDLVLTTILTLNTYGKSVLSSTSGHIGAGYSYTKSSNVGRLNFDARINYSKKNIDASLFGSAILTQQGSEFYRDRENLTALGNYFYNPVWFNQLVVNYQRNLELGLISRIQQGVGIGNRFLIRANMQAKTIVGLVLNREVSTEGRASGNLVEVPVGFIYNFYKSSKPRITVSTTQIFYFSASQHDRKRLDGDTKVRWDFLGDFSLNLSFYNNYDSKPPVLTKSKIDYGVVFNISYDFN